MSWPNNWQKLEDEYNKNYMPYEDEEEIEENEDADRCTEEDGSE